MKTKLDWRQFVDFWSQFYNEHDRYPDKVYYDPYIKDLSQDNFLDKLWLWKMQVHYHNKRNKRALKLIKENIETIRNFRSSNPTFNILYDFSKKIFKSGVVYSVFLIHICKPQQYPIFDQHVFRSFIFLTTGKIIKMPKNIKDYLRYKKFVLKIYKRYKINLRDIDKALMAFGQFLDNPQKFLQLRFS